MVGLVAVSMNPYVVAVYWFLGLGGLFACAGACLSAFPGQGEDDGECHPVRTLACLAAAATIGLIFWSQGRPVSEGAGADLALVGVVLASVAVIGIGSFLASGALLLFRGRSGDEEDGNTSELEIPRQVGGDLTAQEMVA